MTTEKKKLFLLDAFALIYRAYYVFIRNPRINSKGMNTSAIFGFTNTLADVLKNQKPTHIAVVFDSAGPTERHEDFTDYKANREQMPEDIAISIPYIKKIIEAFQIPVIAAEGYEADDIIGAFAKQAEKRGFTTYMMTPDKDFGQLVSEHTLIYKPSSQGKGVEILGIEEVCKKFEIERPDQVIDILGLWGDAVDNIPGIPGIGEKTAKKLIKEYDSIENLIEHAAELKGSLKEKVAQHAEQALLSKKLATILTEVPVDFEEEKLLVGEPDKEKLKEIFTELEFRNLAERILGETIAVEFSKQPVKNGQYDLFGEAGEEKAITSSSENGETKNIATVPHHYHLIDSSEKRKQLILDLGRQKSFCFDTETTGLDPHSAELVGISFAWKPGEAYYVPVPEDQEATAALLKEFQAVFEHPEIEKSGQNIKYDITILKYYGIHVRGPFFDTMLAHYLIHPDMNRRNMDVLAQTYLNYETVSITELIGSKGKHQKTMRSVPVAEICDYACEDADITLQLKQEFEPLLKKTGTEKLFREIETPLIEVLASMEAEGVKINTPELKELSTKLGKDILAMESDIYETAGKQFNISSPKQVGEVLFEHLKVVDKPKKTKTGQYATGEDVLVKLSGKHPVIEKILDYRELNKLKNTYVDPLPALINTRTGRIHTTFNQVVAATGRLSSDKPNLQNIPIRTERGREIRKAFVPRNDEHILLAADYSQIELRIIAELSKDEGMLEAFAGNLDIHSATAAKVFNLPLDGINAEMRRSAKMVNFGIIYGISAFGLSQRLNIPRGEAKDIIDQYFLKYPRVREYMDENIAFARQHGYVETIMGRRRYLKDINSGNAIVRGFAERNAINAPIQGSAADMIKIAMIQIHHAFNKQGLNSKMILQVHDELVFDVVKPEMETVKEIIERHMKSAIPLKVPLIVEMGTGNNWLEAH